MGVDCLFVFHHLVFTDELFTTGVTLERFFILACTFCGETFSYLHGVGVHPVASLTIVAGSFGEISAVFRVLLLPVFHHAVIIWEFISTILAFEYVCFCVLHRYCGYLVLHFYVLKQLLELCCLVVTVLTCEQRVI